MAILASNPLYAAYADADFIGKVIFLVLLSLSVISWVVFVQKTRAANAMRKNAREFKNLFEQSKQQPLQATIGSHSGENPFLGLYYILRSQTLELLHKNRVNEASHLSAADVDLISSYLGAGVSTEVRKLEKNLFILSTVVTLGPFLGLLGTVWGILTTFSELSSKTGQSNEAILSGLAMALGTTILGLLVAIPALVAYNYLKNYSREFQAEMEDFSTLMLATVEMQYRK